VVEKTYKNSKELHSAMFDVSSVEDSGSDEEDGADDADFDQELQLDSDLVHDIEELGEEEQKMLQEADPDADDTEGEPAPIELDSKMAAQEISEESCLGRSEEDAIALSDDEAETTDDGMHESNGASTSDKSKEASQASSATNQGSVDSRVASVPTILPEPKDSNEPYDILSGSRLYRIIFGDSQLGLEVALHEGRIVVARISQERLARLGKGSKPAVGDILSSIAGHSLGLVPNLHRTLSYLKHVLQTPPVELTFLEAPRFIEAFRKRGLLNALEKAEAQQPPRVAQPQNSAAAPSDDLIDLLLDG
jgi:hypothetical protein